MKSTPWETQNNREQWQDLGARLRRLDAAAQETILYGFDEAVTTAELAGTPGQTVFCKICATPMLRKHNGHTPSGRPAYTWFDLAGRLADNCPGCGAFTSAVTTTTTTMSTEGVS